jgi:uncharacterized protein (DUF58 family)
LQAVVNLQRLLHRSQLYQFWRFFSGRAAPERGAVVLTQQRIYILPTRYGLLFGGALALMLVGSINYQLSLGYILTFLLAGMGVVSLLHTYRNLAHLAISAGRVEPAFAGGAVRFHLHLDNPGKFDRVAIQASFAAAADLFDVPVRSSAAATLALPALHRGWLQLPRVTIETRYPVGLCRAWSYVQPDMKALVYPRPDDSSLPPLTFIPEDGDAAHAGSGSEDFAALRPYQPGDSPRHIAWKSAAREQVLLTKVFAGRGASELWLDFTALPPALDLEARLSRLTRQVLLAEAQGVSYGLRLPGRELGPDLGESHCDACLKALALFDVDDDG